MVGVVWGEGEEEQQRQTLAPPSFPSFPQSLKILLCRKTENEYSSHFPQHEIHVTWSLFSKGLNCPNPTSPLDPHIHLEEPKDDHIWLCNWMSWGTSKTGWIWVWNQASLNPLAAALRVCRHTLKLDNVSQFWNLDPGVWGCKSDSLKNHHQSCPHSSSKFSAGYRKGLQNKNYTPDISPLLQEERLRIKLLKWMP